MSTDALEQAQADIEVKAIQIRCLGEEWDSAKERIEVLESGLRQLLAVEDDHMTACDRTMGDSHPCTCGAIGVRLLLAGDSLRCTDCGEEVADLQAHCEREDNICLIHDSETVPDTGQDDG